MQPTYPFILDLEPEAVELHLCELHRKIDEVNRLRDQVLSDLQKLDADIRILNLEKETYREVRNRALHARGPRK